MKNMFNVIVTICEKHYPDLDVLLNSMIKYKCSFNDIFREFIEFVDWEFEYEREVEKIITGLKPIIETFEITLKSKNIIPTFFSLKAQITNNVIEDSFEITFQSGNTYTREWFINNF